MSSVLFPRQGNGPHLSATRLWSVKSGESRWSPKEEGHLAACPQCQGWASRIAEAIAPSRHLRVASASVAQVKNLEEDVREAVRRGEEHLGVEGPEGTIVRFKFLVDHEVVEPCHVEGRLVEVDLPGLGRHVVTKHGGMHIKFEELRSVTVSFDDEGGRVLISSPAGSTP